MGMLYLLGLISRLFVFFDLVMIMVILLKVFVFIVSFFIMDLLYWCLYLFSILCMLLIVFVIRLSICL